MKGLLKTAFLFLAVMALTAATPSQRIGRRSKCDVYLLIGQSNMAGRGDMIPQDTIDRFDGIFLLDGEGRPVPASNPFNQYSTIRKEMRKQQINPGVGFSLFMRGHTKHKILLVVNARGGSSLDQWMPGTDFMNDAVRRTRQAGKYGRLKGILWHQGCSDSSDPLRESYMDRLEVFVSALRDSLDAQTVPFIAGELPEWRPSSPKFNEMISRISERIPYSACVSSRGCTRRGELSDPHFSREGQLLLGRRYGEKMLEMQSDARCKAE